MPVLSDHIARKMSIVMAVDAVAEDLTSEAAEHHVDACGSKPSQDAIAERLATKVLSHVFSIAAAEKVQESNAAIGEIAKEVCCCGCVIVYECSGH